VYQLTVTQVPRDSVKKKELRSRHIYNRPVAIGLLAVGSKILGLNFDIDEERNKQQT